MFAGLQFTSPARTNLPINESHTLQAVTNISKDVSEIFARSCNDCHSNQTNWVWYTNIAPVSWFTVNHVNEGREELNFSEWGTYGDKIKETRLNAICYLVENKKMPLDSYLLLHSEAKLSSDDIKKVCDWTKSEVEKLNIENRN